MKKPKCPKCSSSRYYELYIPAFMPNSGTYRRCPKCEEREQAQVRESLQRRRNKAA